MRQKENKKREENKHGNDEKECENCKQKIVKKKLKHVTEKENQNRGNDKILLYRFF